MIILTTVFLLLFFFSLFTYILRSGPKVTKAKLANSKEEGGIKAFVNFPQEAEENEQTPFCEAS